MIAGAQATYALAAVATGLVRPRDLAALRRRRGA
jgi:hypothetical protein